MRRLTGTYEGLEYTVDEDASGVVSCPAALRDLLEEPDGSLPSGAELEQALRLLWGDTLVIEEVD